MPELMYSAWPPYLDGLQGDTITVASLSFKALAAGSGLIELAVNELGDADGGSLTIYQIGAGAVGVATPVPEGAAPPVFLDTILG